MSSVPTTEQRVRGDVPRYEVPLWRESHGLVAGITGRGDDPGAPFDLGFWSSQPVGDVMSRWRAFRSAFADFPAQVLSHQVHGTQVRWHEHAVPGGFSLLQGDDGHATSCEGLLLLITVADCIPVYLADPGRRAVALLHAGWRGTAGGMLATGVETLARHAGSAPSDLICHVGVGISGPEYEVGAEVLQGVGRAVDGTGPWHLDLRDVLADQARALGIGTFSRSSHCSARDADRFFSHRRSRGGDGRMVAYLGIAGAAPPPGGART